MTKQSRLHATMTRLLEGQYVWGRVDVTPPARSLCTSYRVVVYPPGTNSSERRRLTSRRNWPVTGAVLSMIVLLAASSQIEELLAIMLAITVYIGGFIVWGRLCRGVWPRCRTVEASFMVGFEGTVSAGDPALLASTMRRFHELGMANCAGTITPAQFESRWSTLYDALDDRRLPTEVGP